MLYLFTARRRLRTTGRRVKPATRWRGAREPSRGPAWGFNVEASHFDDFVLASRCQPSAHRCPRALARPHGLPCRSSAAAAMADATYGASTPTETEDERTTLIQKKRPRRLRRSVAAAAALVLCGTAVKVRPRVQEYRLGSDVGELGEYPSATWEAVGPVVLRPRAGGRRLDVGPNARSAHVRRDPRRRRNV